MEFDKTMLSPTERFKLAMEVLDAKARFEMNKKGEKYHEEDNPFANFEENAVDLGLTKYQVLMIYMNKHYRAINKMVKLSPDNPGDAMEHIIDTMNYLRFFHGMTIEGKSNDL